LKGATLDDIRCTRAAQPIIWVNVSGRGDVELIRSIGQIFAFICSRWKT
jgi:hypothetical protein